MSRNKKLYAHGAVRPVELQVFPKAQERMGWRYQLIIGPTVSGEDAYAAFVGPDNIRALMNACRRALRAIDRDRTRLESKRPRKKRSGK